MARLLNQSNVRFLGYNRVFILISRSSYSIYRHTHASGAGSHKQTCHAVAAPSFLACFYLLECTLII